VAEFTRVDATRKYEEQLTALQAKGMRSTMRRVFARCIAELTEPDAAFDALYLEGLFLTGTSAAPLRRRDRFRRLLQELERALPLTGRVAECGCFRGLSSFLICSRLRQRDRGFDGTGYEIYDSFCGLSAPQAADTATAAVDPIVANSMQAGMFAFPLEEVQRALAAFPAISYGPGWIPEAFPSDERSYRFVHVDVDLYQPTKASLEHFWPRLVAGGVMVCDDYNWGGAKSAVDEFAAAVGAQPVITEHTQAVFTAWK
jgi:O-methyltransferase